MSNINRRIAELKGWKVEHAVGGYRLTSPTGSHWSSKDDNATPDEVWDYCEAAGVLPDYEHDLNAAITLIDDITTRITHTPNLGWQVIIGFDDATERHGQALPRVLCEAWLAIISLTVTS